MTEPALVYCKHMDMDVYDGTCAMCTPPEPEQPTLPTGTRLVAHYRGDCDTCGWPIAPGEVIFRQDGGWVHGECGDGDDDE